MYKVYSDSYLIHSDSIESLKIRQPIIDLELNKTGSFEFDIYPNHPYYSIIQKLKSIITVYQDDFLLFRGRVLDDELGFHDEKHVVCEGQLAFLLDSIQRPYNYSGSIKGFLTQLIASHNEQVEESHQFTVGNVTVTDPNNTIARSDIEYTNTLDVINKKLIELLGGYIWIRNENGVNYIDYISDFGTVSSQRVEFSKNILDMKRIRKGEDVATALIPLGAKLKDAEGNETNERLTIKSVNNNVDYIYNADAVAQYGWIFAVQIWDDVTVASNLLTKGQAYLTTIDETLNTIELTAADLASIDTFVESFHLGEYVRVTSNPHGINQTMLVNKLSINLLDPASNRLILGGNVDSFTESIKHDQEIMVNDIQGKVESKVIQETVSAASSMIEQSSKEIMTQVSEGYFLKTDGDELGEQVSEISTTFTQNAEAFEYLFTSAESDMQEVHKYIRFEDGKIILGESTNELTLQIENDKITFMDNGIEVAYFSNNKLYVTDAEILNVLRIGSFGFSPRQNGNLSFTKL